MNALNIKSYNEHMKLSGNYFFILSKGNNAGKPLDRYCPNCFVFLANNQEEKEFYFWLCYGLWQGNYFKTLLCGSVIPFIRIHDLKNVIGEAFHRLVLKKAEFSKTVKTLQNLDEYQKNIMNQLQLIKQTKLALMYEVLKQ